MTTAVTINGVVYHNPTLAQLKLATGYREKADRRQYCAQCRKYHDLPVWMPGKSCGR